MSVESLDRALPEKVNDEIRTPWMTAAECALYLRFVDAEGRPDLDRLYHAKSRLGLPASRMGGGRALRFHRQHVDAWMEQPDAPRRQAPRGARDAGAPSDRAYGTTRAFRTHLADARAQLRGRQ